MNLEEWKAKASKEAVEQYEKPVDWFKSEVKCCRNCLHWQRDPSLIGDYALNCCNMHRRNKKGDICMTRWDAFCDDYKGFAKEKNLLDFAKLEWEAKEGER